MANPELQAIVIEFDPTPAVRAVVIERDQSPAINAVVIEVPLGTVTPDRPVIISQKRSVR